MRSWDLDIVVFIRWSMSSGDGGSVNESRSCSEKTIHTPVAVGGEANSCRNIAASVVP